MQRATITPDAAWRKCLAAGIVAMVFVGATVSAAGASTAPLPVPPEALTGPASWSYPDHDPSNSRLATGSPITAKNLRALTTAWKVTAGGGLPTSPIVVGRSVFVEDQLGEVFDIDLATGRTVWKSPPNGYSVGPEGVAVGWGKVFGVTPTSLFALDETTGRQLWSTNLTHTATDGIDVQPQVIGREVIASTVPVSVKGIY
ncbi:MAG TPA: PQQ-binding-like beta-propeller repeat protein, partial [Acidimicrobiales bacterium]